MICIKKEPGKLPEVVKIENELKPLQEAVGGYIETVTFAHDTCFICNEEGHFMDLPYNCSPLGIDFVGTILVVGVKRDGFCSLAAEQSRILLQRLFGLTKEEAALRAGTSEDGRASARAH